MKSQLKTICWTTAVALGFLLNGNANVHAQARVFNMARANANLYRRNVAKPAFQSLPVRGVNVNNGYNSGYNYAVPSNNFNAGYNSFGPYPYSTYSDQYPSAYPGVYNGYNSGYNSGYNPYSMNPYGASPYGYYPGY